jgi:hypothetical protein
MASPRGGEHIALPLAWLEDGLFVDRDTPLLRKGDRILAMGGLELPQVLAKLRAFVAADNDGWTRYRGQFVLTDLGVLRWLGIADDAPVPVRVERDGAILELAIPKGSPPLEFDPSQPWVRYEIDASHDLGVFTLDVCRNDEHYHRTLRAFFAAVHAAGIGRIAVDVRKNTGGDSWVINEFLRYLDVELYREYSGEIRWSAESLRQRGEKRGPGYVRYGPWERPNEKVADMPAFRGLVYILTSNATYSSGAWFAVMLGDNGLAQIVGEPPGSAPSAYGDVLDLTLPNSAFAYRMSFKKWVRPDPGRDPATSLEPDHHLARARRDLVEGTDPALGYLRAGGR